MNAACYYHCDQLRRRHIADSRWQPLNIAQVAVPDQLVRQKMIDLRRKMTNRSFFF